jgi:hypothetical protein
MPDYRVYAVDDDGHFTGQSRHPRDTQRVSGSENRYIAGRDLPSMPTNAW